MGLPALYRSDILDVEAFADTFWSRVDKTGDCWLWQRYRKPRGYGICYPHFKDNPQRGHYTHRVSYVLTYGHIPDELLVLHHCDNPPCCNPKHLFLGTQHDNAQDMVAKDRARKTGKHGDDCPASIMTEKMVMEMRELYAQDVDPQEIAAIYGFKKRTIEAAVTGHNWKHLPMPEMHRTQTRVGIRSNGAKLKDEDIPVIRTLHANNCTINDIASRYSVTRTAITEIVKRQTWKHIA